MIQGEAEIERQKRMGYGRNEGEVDWKDVKKTLNFHLRLDVDAYHLEITANKLEGIVTAMPERDLRTNDMNVAINAAKNEYESKNRNDHTLCTV